MQRLHELIYRSLHSFTFYSQYHKYLFAISYYTNKRERERYGIIYYINYSFINRTLIILKYKLNNASQTNVKSRHLSENACEERIGRAQLHKTQLFLFLSRSFSVAPSFSLSPSRSLFDVETQVVSLPANDRPPSVLYPSRQHAPYTSTGRCNVRDIYIYASRVVRQ